jgi:hypothetical protein
MLDLVSATSGRNSDHSIVDSVQAVKAGGACRHVAMSALNNRKVQTALLCAAAVKKQLTTQGDGQIATIIESLYNNDSHRTDLIINSNFYSARAFPRFPPSAELRP